MKNKLLIIGLLLLSNCELTDQNHFDIEKKLKPFVDSFYVESAKRGRTIQRDNLIVYFMPLKGLMGRSMNLTTIPTVQIDPGIFNKYAKEKKMLIIEYVVFHELGHALLNRDHLNAYTIMTTNNKMLFAYTGSEQARTLLIDELFGANENSITDLTSNIKSYRALEKQDCDG